MPTTSTTIRETPDASTAYRSGADEVIAALASDEQRGLNDEEARTRLGRFGPNEFASEEPVPGWRRFLAQFQDVLVVLLLVATAVSACLWILEGDAALPYESIAILAVVLLNATMGYIQRDASRGRGLALQSDVGDRRHGRA